MNYDEENKDYYESIQGGFQIYADSRSKLLIQLKFCTSKYVISIVFKKQQFENHSKEKPKVSYNIPLSELLDFT